MNKKSEVAQLLAFMSAFDKRVIGPADVEAWACLDVIQRYDIDTCRAAVVKFFNLPADERGNSTYLDPRQFKSMVRLVRRDQEREASRERAISKAIYAEELRGRGLSYDTITQLLSDPLPATAEDA